jgi:hypothetical protein
MFKRRGADSAGLGGRGVATASVKPKKARGVTNGLVLM